MGKPPTTDQELSARVAALEERADATDVEIASLDARVTALEVAAGGGEPLPPSGAHPDHELPRPPVRPDHTLPVPEPKPPEVTPPTTGRAVTILLDGASHLFTQEGGTDLGAYTDPQGRFVQHCIAARCDTLADFTVFFRPDTAGDREEVVFEFGRCHGNPTGSVLGAYSAVITRDGETLADIDVPPHAFYSRWRWQSAPRPVTTTAAELMAAKLVPHYDKALMPGVRATVHADAGPLQTNGIMPNMGTTGERDDIGVFTESQADWLMYEDAQALGTVRAWLEGSGAFPWHHRDENTGAPIDFINTYPNVSSYASGQYGNPPIPAAYSYQSFTDPDTSHCPTLAYLPFLLTGDPYALEELQFVTTFDYVHFGGKTLYGLDNALRTYVWHLRNIAQCVAATPESVPSWLQPKAYWETYLAGALPVSLEYGPNQPADTYQHQFHDIGYPGLDNLGNVSGGQEEYAMGVYLHMVDLGLDGWAAMRDWKVQSCIARTNGTSGWNRSVPNCYIRAYAAGSPTAPVHADWAAVWDYNCGDEHNAYMFSGADPTQAHLGSGLDWSFCTSTAACLNWAERQGVDVAASRAWLGPEMAGHWNGLRWAVA